ncbi:MAG: putative rane protein [Verrucomicrobiota bacterium]|jgi:uncharacterized membrane-anchored protein
MKIRPALLAVFALCATAAFAADAPPTPAETAARLEKVRQLVAALKPQSGEVTLAGGVAKAVLPADLRYLNPSDTATVLTKLWGNPSGKGTLGMLVPANFDPLEGGGWAVVMTFEEDGYVKDDDAAKIDYAKLLGEMKDGVREASKEREKQGYGSIELVGWAKPPRYDVDAKKLYWAKELKFGGATENTLNYNIRMLGRRGVLVLNAVAGMKELAQVEAATPALLAAVNFQDGHRYADFKEGTDKVATYGIAALVAGGIAAKAGFFKALWLGILAFKKFIIIGVIALASQFGKLWNWIRGQSKENKLSPPPPTLPPPSDTPPPTA